MRKIIGILFAVSLVVACSSIDCPVNHSVYTRYMLYQPDGTPDTLVQDTMWVLTMRSDGKDTLVLNSLCGSNATGFSLPISYTQPEDKFIVLVRRLQDPEYLYYDSIIVKKENFPHFESVDCQASFFHRITNVRCMGNFIDSIVINNPDVNYDKDSPEHFRLYLNPDF